MKVLVINSGSSSLKYQLIDTTNQAVLCKGNFEKIGESDSFYSHNDEVVKFACSNHGVAISRLFEIIPNASEIQAIGHRVVHGGEFFKGSAVATPENLAEVEKVTALAPLHNPANIAGIKECIARFPGVPNVMVFDTAFHSTMPKSAYLYALPLNDYNEHKIRRYGFHGTSHNFVAKKAVAELGRNIKDLKIITVHAGNGCSVAAIDGGVSVETSMGVTPLEGLVMGTRSGDIDPAIVEILCKAHNMSISQCVQYLNKKSGLLGLSNGKCSDMRDMMELSKTDDNAKTAIDCFVHRVTKYIGAYVAVMNGVDIIVFTGGIGSNNHYIRERVMSNFGYIGATIDKEANTKTNAKTGFADISAKDARTRTYVITTNEELEIAIETRQVLKNHS